MDEFAVIIFATSGDFRAFPEGSPGVADIRNGVVKYWQKDDRASGNFEPLTALIKRLTGRTIKWADFVVFFACISKILLEVIGSRAGKIRGCLFDQKQPT
jgi:hypothetical protein